MKKIDIDKLKRENIYPLPTDFFHHFEEKMMNKVAQIEQNKIHPLPNNNHKKWYLLVASIVLLISVGLLFPTEKQEEKIVVTQKNNIKQNETITIKNPIPQQPTSIVENEPIVEKTKTIATATKISTAKPQKIKETPQPINENVDTFLASYSENELATLSTEAENDVYLDIYY